MTKLNDKTAIITGAASGIGAATALRVAREGARTVVADINLEGAEKITQAIREAGGEAIAVRVDLADSDSVRAAVRSAVDAFGRLDVLHNNAAATHLSARFDLPVLEADPEIWDQTMAINVRGTMVATQAALPHLIETGGCVINTVSDSGLVGDVSNPAYGASKAAVIALTQYTATQYGKDGVRANAISPGFVATPATAGSTHGGITDVMLRHALTPRLGLPEDIAGAVVFLASEDATYITGQVLQVDGGLLAHQPYVADMRAALA
ncbi:SDR family NAD(P)-dependent oxidoreductase [Streptomyces sp. NPDC101234]|uniref:SDR family NAD(P)-dependent oxidoreductase n=1 Tax=Streptomyces sp. NPDC101234 TaxID=3366138 RepID=UPI0038004B57